MLNITRLALLFCTLLLGACTITGPADDGYDKSNEWVDNGTLLSDDTKTLYDSEAKKSSATVEPAQTSTTATTATTATSDKDEFEQFKEWNRLRGQGVESAEYQEFLQWQEFQKFKATQ